MLTPSKPKSRDSAGGIITVSAIKVFGFFGSCRNGFLLFLLAFSSSSVWGRSVDCSRFVGQPEVRFEVARPDTVYRSVPRSYIMNLMRERASEDANIGGLTHAEFFLNYSFNLTGVPTVGGYCVSVAEIVVRMGYASMEVLIDERYRPGSCEYYVLRSHEAKHVNINNYVLDRYAPLIREEIMIASMGIEPVFVRSIGGAGMDRALRRAITENERVVLLVERLKERQAYLDSLIDTPEEYARMWAMCSNW